MEQKIERLERQVKVKQDWLEGKERGKGLNERKTDGGSEGRRKRTHRNVSTSLYPPLIE